MDLFSGLRKGLQFLVVATATSVYSAPASAAPFVYVVNAALNANSVSVIDAADNTVIATIPVEFGPEGIAITPDGRYAYVTSAVGHLTVIRTATNTVIASIDVGCFLLEVAAAPDGKHVYTTDVCGTLSVIDVATNTVTAAIDVTFFDTVGVAISPDSTRAYVTTNTNELFVIDTTTNTVAAGPIALEGEGTASGVTVAADGKFVYLGHGRPDAAVLVLDTANNSLIATIPVVGGWPWALALTPDGQRLYVTNALAAGFVSAIDVASRTITANLAVGSFPFGIAVSANGRLAYVTNQGSDTVFVIDITADVLVASIAVGHGPFGIAVTPFTFAGIAGKPNCDGKSVSELAREFGGLENAAAHLGFAGVQALQSAIRRFCER